MSASAPPVSPDVPARLSTYNEFVLSNPAYSATFYRARLPYAILTVVLSSAFSILSFFFLPWLSIDVSKIGSISLLHLQVSGFDIATGRGTLDALVPQALLVHLQPGPGSGLVVSMLWLLVPIWIIQVLLVVPMFWNKIVTKSLSLIIPLSFGVALLLEVIYLFSGFFVISNPLISTYPSSGLGVSIVITLIAGGISLFLIPDLNWCWQLCQDDKERFVRLGNWARMTKSDLQDR